MSTANSASLNEISQNVLNLMRGGRSHNDEHVSKEQIKFAINYYRSTFIRRDQQRNNNRFRMFEQDLEFVDVETITGSGDINNPTPSLYKATVEEIPTPVRLKNHIGLTHIGCNDKNAPSLPLIDAHRAGWQQYRKYTADDPFAFYRDGKVFVQNDITIQKLNIRGIFEDPEEVHDFTRENGFDVYDDDSPYPIPLDMLEGITKGLINGELKIAVGSLNDDETDMTQDEQ